MNLSSLPEREPASNMPQKSVAEAIAALTARQRIALQTFYTQAEKRWLAHLHKDTDKAA